MQEHSVNQKFLLRKVLLLIPFSLLLLGTSCRVTKNVPENEYLLDHTQLNIESNEKKTSVKKSKLQNYIKQKPNKRVLGFRLHLGFYNLARKGKEKGINKLFRTIGEEPVILDTLRTNQSAENLERYILSKGYHNAQVEQVTELKKSRANVKYLVRLGDPFIIEKINHVIEDTIIRNIVLEDKENSLLTKGQRFDMDLLRDERIRIEKVLKEEGYFLFTREFITFTADTSIGNNKVELDLVIRNQFIRNEFGDKIPQPYRQHAISNVYIYTTYDPVQYYQLEERGELDTTIFDHQHFIYSNSPGIKLKSLSEANLLRPNQIFSEQATQKTRDNLNALRLYRAVNVFYRPDEEANKWANQEATFLQFHKDDEPITPSSLGMLNCYIQLTPHTLQNYQIELVGTNVASDIGAEGNLSYQHKNFFNGAELLETKFRAMVQFLAGEHGFNNSVELGGSIGLSFPRFLGPFTGHGLVKRFAPRTQLSLSYNYQRRPDYTRTIAGMNYSYKWRHENKFSHTLIPTEINVINIFSIDDNFLDRIANTYLANSYINQLVTVTGYGITYSNQSTGARDYIVVRGNVELSGNILNAAHSFLGEKTDDGTYHLFNTSFSQFAKTDINIIFNQKLDANNTIVYRLFAGAGLPYGNSKALPFEKKYFSGGSSGVRAWHARGLGPGTFVEDQLIVPNQTADIKLEANIEYRFPLFWLLEGALFVDAGNIWAITEADERPGAVFYPKTFYKQIALGTGSGLRMNLGFFTLRFDLGMKLHDPGIKLPSPNSPQIIPENYGWLPFNKRYSFKEDFTFHFGIGYPF